MLLVLLVVCVALFFLGVWLLGSDNDVGCFLAAFSAIGFVIVLIVMLVLGGCVVKDSKLEEKITMYTQENEAIERQIAACVEQYQQYESGVFAEVAPADSVTLVTLYPELKSDSLVQAQIEAYISNSNNIKSLKERQIDASVNKWWLYFGK